MQEWLIDVYACVSNPSIRKIHEKYNISVQQNKKHNIQQSSSKFKQFCLKGRKIQNCFWKFLCTKMVIMTFI